MDGRMDGWMQAAKEQLAPISALLEKLQHEREELVARRRQKQEEGQEKVEMFFGSCLLHCGLLYSICNLLYYL